MVRTPASSQEQQQRQRQRSRMWPVKVRQSQEEIARSASQLSQEVARDDRRSAATGGLRERQQQQQSRRSGGDSSEQKKRVEAKKRKKRSSYDSTGSGTSSSSSSAFASSEGSQTTAQSSQAWQEHLRLHGEPDAVIHVGGCSFGIHLRVLGHQSGLLHERVIAFRGQSAAHDTEHGDSSYFSSSGGSSAEVEEALAPPMHLFSIRVVDGSRYLNNSIGSENALSSSPVRCPLAMSRDAPVSRDLGGEKRRKTEATGESIFSSVHCIAHTTSRSSEASAASSTNDSTISEKSEPKSSPPMRARKTRPTVPAGSPMVLRSRTKQQRGRGTFTTSMIAGTSDFANAGTQDSPIVGPAERVEKENWDHTNRQSPEAAQDLDHQAFILGLQRQQEEERQAALKEQQAAERKLEAKRKADQPEHQQVASNSQQLAVVPAKDLTSLLHVEWCHADPAAVATLLEFLYTQQVRLVNEDSAEQVIQLCRWLSLENDLLYTCLSIAIERMPSETWMNALEVCSKLKNGERKSLLVEQLLKYIREISPERYPEILKNVRMEYLTSIEDRELLTLVVKCFTNHIRHVGVWRNVLFGLELWMSWTFRQQKTLSLSEFHRQYAPWEPFVTLPGVEIGGEEYYVCPKTLFCFGAFSFQVRFELNSLVLIQWRVVKEVGSQSDSLEEVSLHPMDPAFSLRGDMLVRFKCFRKGPTHEQIVPLKYRCSAGDFGVWKPLIESSSASTTLLSRAEIRGGRRSGEEGPSPSESVAASQSQSQPEPQEEKEDEEAVEFMRARFMGRFFVWSHELCNLYHYLSVCSLFYSSPTGSIGDLLNLNVIDKMRRLPIDSLVMILQSDRLRVPGGETMLVQILTYLCFNADSHTSSSSNNSAMLFESGGADEFSVTTDFSAINIVRELFGCVRWCYVDLSQIMTTLERSARKYQLYELIANGLKDPLLKFPRRTPWGKDRNPYQVVTSLVEFEIEAGDRSLSPSCYPPDLSNLSVSD